ncbi:hypothetical protein E4T56_gene17137 [Termitomyces sp. T112]|nr:hypothetical protein E4T56_gene17137 [Termitomyces sp. T112]
MGIRRYDHAFTILVFVIFILAQLGDGRPVAATLTDGVPSFVANASSSNILVATTVGHIDHSSVAASLTRIENYTSSGTVNSAHMSKSDSDTTVAVPTIVSIVVLLALLCVMLIYPWFITGHQVDVFHSMQRTVRHTRLIAASRPTSNARGYMSRTSVRSADSISGASTECAVPINECLPVQASNTVQPNAEFSTATLTTTLEQSSDSSKLTFSQHRHVDVNHFKVLRFAVYMDESHQLHLHYHTVIASKSILIAIRGRAKFLQLMNNCYMNINHFNVPSTIGSPQKGGHGTNAVRFMARSSRSHVFIFQLRPEKP